jgi:hypothetical protein
MRKIIYTTFALAFIGGISSMAVKEFKNSQAVTTIPAATSENSFIQVGGNGTDQTDRSGFPKSDINFGVKHKTTTL